MELGPRLNSSLGVKSTFQFPTATFHFRKSNSIFPKGIAVDAKRQQMLTDKYDT